MNRGRLGHITDQEVQRKESKHVSAIVDQKSRQDRLRQAPEMAYHWE